MALPSSAFVRVVSADSKTNSETVLRLSDGATATDVLTAMGNKQLPRVEPNALAKYSLIMVAAAEARASDPPAKRRYTLRTLAASDRPLELAAERGQQRLSAARASSSAAGRNDSAVRWYFKDTTKAPLRCVVRACSSDRSLTPPPRFEDDSAVSGDEESEDEAECKRSDLTHLLCDGAAQLSGTLLKRSASDPNLWRRRQCVLAADRLWYVCAPLLRPPPFSSRSALRHAADPVTGGLMMS